MGSARQQIAGTVPVVRVTLLEDRAHVTRRGTVELGAGLTRVSVEGVSPVVHDKSLVARAVEGALQVVDARVLRRAAPRGEAPAASASAVSTELAEVRAAYEQAEDEQRAVEVAIRATQERIAWLDELAAVTLRELAVDVAWGRAPDAETERQLEAQREERLRVRARLVPLARQQQNLEGQRRRLSKRIGELEDKSTELLAALELDVHADGAGTFAIEVDYVVPGACWRPYHTAELTDGEVRFSTDGCVWQRSGEDWRDVELSFSTERASLGTEPPTLTTDLLRVRRRPQTLEVEARDQAVETASQGQAADGVPGIDDGGEALLLRGLARADVPSDGRPHRVPLATFTADAECERVCVPELDTAVILKSTQDNRGPRPILAGPVDLIRQSGLCGKTSVLFIGPGERFELGWGPESDIRVQRDESVKTDEAGLLSSWIAIHHKVEVRLSNLGGEAHTVRVRERVPVSEIEKVKIEPRVDHTTGGVTPDRDGFVDWEVKLAPRGRHDLVLRYLMKKHTDVVGL